MIKLTIQKAPDGVWIVDIIVQREGHLPLEQSWKSGTSDSPEDVYEAIVHNVLPSLLTQPSLLEYARTA